MEVPVAEQPEKKPTHAEILRELRKQVDHPMVQCMTGTYGEPQFLRACEYLLFFAEAGLDAYTDEQLQIEVAKRERAKEALGLARLYDKQHPPEATE